MKKVLFVFMISVPSFAMEPSPYETRLKNVENAVTDIKDILEGEEIPGLKPRVETNATAINSLRDNTRALSDDIEELTASLASAETRLSSHDVRLENVEADVADIKDILNDKTDSSGKTILGLKSQVRINTTTVDSLKENIGSMSEGISSLTTSLTTSVNSLSSQIFDILSSIDGVEEKINKGWDTFLEEKFQEYMQIKKKVLDIISACKANGNPTPTYIMETAAQLQECSLDVRRKALSDILGKLNVFATLLDSDKLDSLQEYINNTSVPAPKLKEVQPLLSGIVVEGEYLKVSGATRTFTRASGFKRGLPKQDWMDQSCDYFAYGLRPVLEKSIARENLSRSTSNAAVELTNALARAGYNAAIQAAERMTFPADNFTDLVTDYNRLLTHHDI